MNATGRFSDLRAGGRELAAALAPYAGRGDVRVLGIVRGGVPAAVEVGRALGAPVDVLLIRRLLLPRGPHDPVCAVSAAGHLVLDDEAAEPGAPGSAARAFVADALAAFAGRVCLCRGHAPPAPLDGRTVLLVDNGVHTGGTLRIAVRALRALRPARIVAAVPVAAAGTRAELEALADDAVCLAWADALANVAQAYARFPVPAIEEVAGLLRDAWLPPRDRPATPAAFPPPAAP